MQTDTVSLAPSVTGRMPISGKLAGRRILVVGGGGPSARDPDAPVGNGQAVSVLCAREGAAVAVADIDAAAAAATVDDIAAAGAPQPAVAVIADAADPEASARMVAEAAEALGGLDGLVLNVGTAAGLRLEGTTPEDWDKVLGVNLRTPFLAAKAALPLLGAGASIVFVGSLAGLKPGTTSPSYDASKAGLVGLMKHVALEGAPIGVRSNLIAPGLIDTAMGRAASAMEPARDRVPIPLGRQGSAWEVAYGVSFLLSDEASYITAQTLVVDGGLEVLPLGR